MTDALKTITLTPADATLDTMYTCPASTTALVKGMFVSGKKTAKVTIELTDVSASATKVLESFPTALGQENFADKDALLEGLVLEAGDIIKVQVSVASSADFTLSVDESTATAATDEHQINVGPVVTVGNDLNTSAVVVKRAGSVSAVTYVPLTTITGANTQTRKVVLVNKGQAGLGATIIASLEFDSGVNATGEDEKAITLSVTPSDLVVAAGDVLEWQSTHIGTGIADPGGKVHITITPS